MMSAQGIGITTDEKQRESAERNLADPFDLFTKPGIEQDHISKEEVKFRPTLEIKDDAPINFEIKTYGNYLEGDSLQTEFFLKIENEDGVTPVTATDDVAPINMIGATILFYVSEIKLSSKKCDNFILENSILNQKTA